jgi:hypothetical protein
LSYCKNVENMESNVMDIASLHNILQSSH